MKLTIAIIAEHGTISAAIEAIAHESDSIASGIIGPSFACSGPGSGWQQNFDVTDYAKRALDDAFGASSYIDSSDGTAATMEDGELVWSEDSVVEIDLPTVAECLKSPDAWKEISANGAGYGMDAAEIEELSSKVAAPYRISDGNATEYAESLEEAGLSPRKYAGRCLLSDRPCGSTALPRTKNQEPRTSMSKSSSKKLLESITTAGRVVVRDYGRGPSRYQVTIYSAAARKMMTVRCFEREDEAMGHAQKWLAEHPGTEIPQLPVQRSDSGGRQSDRGTGPAGARAVAGAGPE